MRVLFIVGKKKFYSSLKSFLTLPNQKVADPCSSTTYAFILWRNLFFPDGRGWQLG